jgi:multiple sugar transport system permease protein
MSLFTIGEGFVILLVARRAIPSALYELAAPEDATWWDLFRRITLPVMAPALALLFLRDLVLGLQTTYVPSLEVWDGGPPDYGTTYLGLFVYRNAFEHLRYGYAAAATVAMLLLTASGMVVQLWAIRRWGRRAVATRRS